MNQVSAKTVGIIIVVLIVGMTIGYAVKPSGDPEPLVITEIATFEVTRISTVAKEKPVTVTAFKTEYRTATETVVSTPSPTVEWTDIYTFKGIGDGKTVDFFVPVDYWRLVWETKMTEIWEPGIFYFVVYVHSGETVVHSFGGKEAEGIEYIPGGPATVYLEVEAPEYEMWTIRIQILKEIAAAIR